MDRTLPEDSFHGGSNPSPERYDPTSGDAPTGRLYGQEGGGDSAGRDTQAGRLYNNKDKNNPGHSLEGERRLVTILFCDVSGSTELAEQLDPEEWAEMMNAAFEYLIAPVQRYEGTVARLMGDAILAFFGAPLAHEDDPVRAVLAGLDILAGIQPFRLEFQRDYGLDFNLRVGINSGSVVVGEIGKHAAGEYTAMGDAVNLAARMEQTAQPGTLQISAETYKFVTPLFET